MCTIPSERRVPKARPAAPRTPAAVLSNEDAGAFESLIAGYEAYFDPPNPIQHDLVEEIAAAIWRQRRIWNIQTAAVDHEMDRQEPALKAEYAQIDECTRIALAVRHLTDHSKLLSNLSRYESRHRRAYDREVEKLESQEKMSRGKTNPVATRKRRRENLAKPDPCPSVARETAAAGPASSWPVRTRRPPAAASAHCTTSP
jgi:hypothetical protein